MSKPESSSTCQQHDEEAGEDPWRVPHLPRLGDVDGLRTEAVVFTPALHLDSLYFEVVLENTPRVLNMEKANTLEVCVSTLTILPGLSIATSLEIA